MSKTERIPRALPVAAAPARSTARHATRRQAEADVLDEPSESGSDQYPTAKYRRVPTSVKFPHGYEARAVSSHEEELRLGPGWFDSPDEALEGKAKSKPRPRPTSDDLGSGE